MENASSRDVDDIGDHFGFHPLTVEDVQSAATREKLEIFANYLFLVFHSIHQQHQTQYTRTLSSSSARALTRRTSDVSNEVMRTSAIKLIVFPSLVISFSTGRAKSLRIVRQRLQRDYDNHIESTSWIIHALLDQLTDALLPVVSGNSLEVDALEDLIYVLSGAEHRDLLRRMGVTRRRLAFLRQRLWAKRDMLISLIGRDWQSFLTGIQLPYLRDVYDHVVTMLHKIEAANDLLLALQNTYLANVSIDVNEQSKQSNLIMKRLSAVATIVLPLTLLAGIMGMNVTVPYQHDTDWQSLDALTPFICIISAMLGLTIIMIVYFRQVRLM